MKNILALLAVFALILTAAPGAGAEGTYVGLKTSLLTIEQDEEDDPDIDDITTVGILVGMPIGDKFAVELEYADSISGGDFTYFGAAGETDIWYLAAYGVYKHPVHEIVDLRAKLGWVHSEYEITVAALGFTFSDDDDEASFGLGAGFKLGEAVVLDVEYTYMEADGGGKALSAALNYTF